MEKDRVLFLDEKRNAMMKRTRLLETLKKEQNDLQERLNIMQTGPHARKESKVRSNRVCL